MISKLVWYIVENIQLLVMRRIVSRNLAYVFDIDNTLAKTREIRIDGELSAEDYASLAEYSGVASVMRSVELNKCCVFVITARPLKSYFVTRRWLRAKCLPFDFLFMVKHPKSKIKLIESINKKSVVYDDLSYGYGDDIKIYEYETREIAKIPGVRLVTGDELMRLQSEN